ncbi:universal stress protein, partial [Streptacidiphilus carbonis]|uniref:universal stress protein n=1 Tax=Streptacidiphilus carbonis TaxID=105422 RepID=UPI001377A953
MVDQHQTADRIVVGVDGSDSSKQALRWALRQAELTGGVLEAVTAWDLPQFYGSLGWVPPSSTDEAAVEARARGARQSPRGSRRVAAVGRGTRPGAAGHRRQSTARSGRRRVPARCRQRRG